MNSPSREISNLIDELDGGTAVAAAINELLPPTEKPVDRESVYKWKEANRAPYRIRPYLARVAAANGKRVPDALKPYAPQGGAE